jgi:hypothetical protein
MKTSSRTLLDLCIGTEAVEDAAAMQQGEAGCQGARKKQKYK